jgi:opacity protein-like surface antigen
MKQFVNKAIFILCLVSVTQAYAFDMDDEPDFFQTESIGSKWGGGEWTFSVGGFKANTGKQQLFILPGQGTVSMTPTDKSNSSGLIGGQYLVDRRTRGKTTFAYGLSLYYLFPAKVKGNMSFQNQSQAYQYKITNLPLYGSIQAKVCTDYEFMYILDGGLGVNYMMLNKYIETSTGNGGTPSDSFKNNNVLDFSATAGIGLRFTDIFKEMTLELGYRFFYLGQGKLKSNISFITGDLKTGNVYANAVILSVVF